MNNTREVANWYRMAQWAEVIQDRKESGESVEHYCRNRGLSRDSYFYWQRKLREAACERMVAMETAPKQTGLATTGFTEVLVRESHQPCVERVLDGRLTIEASGMKITADAIYPVGQLACLLREMAGLC